MRNARRQVRHERSVRRERSTAPAPPVVAVTGAARGVGQALAVQLAESPLIDRVVAIDDHRGDAARVTWRVADVRDPTLAARLAGVDVVVHADMDTSAVTEPRQRRALNVRGAQTVLTAAAAERVGRVVLVTSAMVYGARPDNPVPLPEDAPLLADADGSVAGDLLEVEEIARRSRRVNPGTAVTVVRPAGLVGDGVDTLLTRHFEAPRLLIFRPGDRITVTATRPSRLMFLGGAALEGPRYLWWNFVSSRKERIEEAKEEWKTGKFALIPGDEKEFIPLPEN